MAVMVLGEQQALPDSLAAPGLPELVDKQVLLEQLLF